MDLLRFFGDVNKKPSEDMDDVRYWINLISNKASVMMLIGQCHHDIDQLTP